MSSPLPPDHCADVLAGCYDVPLPHTPPPRILDIGANVGAFARWAAARWPGARIESYEPHPDNFAHLLAASVQLGGSIHAHCAAVGECLGRRDLRLGRNNCGEHSFHDLGEQTEDSVEVAVLDATTLTPADFIKIDTEGCELEILRRWHAACPAFLDLAQAVALEYHREADLPEIYGILEAHGLTCTFHRARCRDRGELKFLRTVPRVFVAIPNNDDPLSARIRASVQAMQRECPFPVYGAEVAGDGVARARNNLVAAALQSDATHVYFAACDTTPTPAHLTRLVGHRLPIVGGLYAKKQARLAWVASALDGAARDERTGLQEVAETGTDSLLVAREVFHTMIAAYPESLYRDDPAPGDVRHDFFPMHAKGGRYLSEDWYFCHRARECGFKVFVDWRCIIPHLGLIAYPLASFLPDEALADLLHHVTGHPAADITAFLNACPRKQPARAAFRL